MNTVEMAAQSLCDEALAWATAKALGTSQDDLANKRYPRCDQKLLATLLGEIPGVTVNSHRPYLEYSAVIRLNGEQLIVRGPTKVIAVARALVQLRLGASIQVPLAIIQHTAPKQGS